MAEDTERNGKEIMVMTYEQALNRLFERTSDNTSQLNKQIRQRRNGMEDLYGVMFSADGDGDNPARFYISLSPDYTYLEMFAFKLVISPYKTTVKGGTTSATVTVNDKSLSVSGDNITPNPHNHTTQAHTHNLVNGISFVNLTAEDFTFSINGVDITDYLQEQHDGYWIDGAGVYPTDEINPEDEEDEPDFYDILAVASMMTAEADAESDADAKQAILNDRNKILRRGFKPVEISASAPFHVDAYLYLKYPHVNR